LDDEEAGKMMEVEAKANSGQDSPFESILKVEHGLRRIRSIASPNTIEVKFEVVIAR